ncbi:MAG: peroxiredoxin-like family protein [Planctomycetota bacterium]
MARADEPKSLSSRLSHRARRAIQSTTDLAYVAGLGLAVSASPLAAQHDEKPKARETAMTQSQPGEGQAQPETLQTELDALKSAFEQRAPQETIDAFEKGIVDVEALGVLDQAKNVGDRAPAFTLPDGTGESVSMESILADGPAIVTFYRGSWCPYCNIQLRAYQQRMDEITALGASLVAISPEKPTAEDAQDAPSYEFHVLSDAGNEVADAFGIRYRLPQDLIDAFSGRLDLASYNGDGSWTLPLGATYVIDRDGTIAHAFLTADYRKRAEPDDLIAALEKLAAEG